MEKAKQVVQSLSDLIAPLRLDWKNGNITEENFPVLPEDGVEFSKKEFKLYDFVKTISSKNSIEAMERDGFRPATVREQLQWAKDHWNRRDWVVALGQTWLDSDGDLRVSVLLRDDGKCGLFLDLFQFGWYSSYRFLAVRK